LETPAPIIPLRFAVESHVQAVKEFIPPISRKVLKFIEAGGCVTGKLSILNEKSHQLYDEDEKEKVPENAVTIHPERTDKAHRTTAQTYDS